MQPLAIPYMITHGEIAVSAAWPVNIISVNRFMPINVSVARETRSLHLCRRTRVQEAAQHNTTHHDQDVRNFRLGGPRLLALMEDLVGHCHQTAGKSESLPRRYTSIELQILWWCQER